MSIATGLAAFASLRETPVRTDYTTQITETRQGGGRWLPGLLFTVGYTWPDQEPSPVPLIELDKHPCSHFATLLLDEQKRLVTSIDQSSLRGLVPSSMYLKARATLSLSGQAFEGEVSSRKGDETGTPPYAWKGTVAPRAAAAHDNAIAMIRAVTEWRQENGLC